ncbi:DNA polymerase subunit gamma-1-like isoform X2 [Panulirus ornatus]|uniref:DNA polymerase subunit gamma-1-like isoform X2 n=1 Tax=Panulirus ornatus TaxID=150431 RepID=UPI003A8752E6
MLTKTVFIRAHAVKMGKNIFATGLHLRKFSSSVYCMICLPRIQAEVRHPLSYMKLHFIVQRCKSTYKKILDKAMHDENHLDLEECNQFPDAHTSHLPFSSPKISKIKKNIRQNSVYKTFGDDPTHVNISSHTKNPADESSNRDIPGQAPDIGIISVKEVLESVQEDLFRVDHVDNPASLKSKKLHSKKLDVTRKTEIYEQKHKAKITDKRKRSQSKDIPRSRKKIVFLKNEKEHREGLSEIICKMDPMTKNTYSLIADKAICTDLNQYGKSSECDLDDSVLPRENEYIPTVSKVTEKDTNVTENIDNLESCKIVPSDPTIRHDMQRKNPLGIQNVSTQLFNQIFSKVTPKDPQEAEEDLQRSKEHLQAHGLWNKKSSVLPDYDFKLPPLEDQDIDQHFRIVAEEQCGSYKILLNQLVAEDLPNLPNKWQFAPGWTRYNSDGSYTQVDFPDCHAIVFDVEVCMKEGNQPTLATAVSDKYWYSWCSNYLIYPHHEHGGNIGVKDLIPLETSDNMLSMNIKSSGVPRVVVGHNVSYDRIRVREQYLMEGTPLRFVDTMSLHIAVSGLVSEQRALLMKNRNSKNQIKLPWMFVGCENSLNEVYRFYCHSEENLDKSTRNVFVDGTLKDIRDRFQELMNYCSSDVKVTHMVLVKLLPLFFERFPHPVTFAGMLEMGLTFLPVTENWNKYIRAAESEFNHVERLLNEELVKQAQAALKYMEKNEYEEDLWLWSLDWSKPKGKVKKLPGYPNWYRKLCARTGEKQGSPEPENMSTRLQIVPKLLRLTWDGFPLHYERQYGWGYLKPLYSNVSEIPHPEIPSVDSNDKEMPVFPVKALYEACSDKGNIKEQTDLKKAKRYNLLGIDENLELLVSENDNQNGHTSQQISKHEQRFLNIGIPGVAFVPLPHKDGTGNRVGNPLAKDFLSKLEDKTLSSHFGDIAELVLKTTKTISYWKNNRDRILSQMVIWNDHSCLPHSVTKADGYKSDGKYGIILPMAVTAGTITRRAVERTWMTASNAYADRIGSELKAMVEAPPGYKFVGADVDSQELWIAAVLGDAYFSGEHGATALGWMTLQGKKSDGTDMHSRTANSVGISRDHAKIINYGRIYGAGLNFLERLLKQFNPSLTDIETKERAKELFSTTKGKKGWYLNQEGKQLARTMDYPLTGEALSRRQINKMLWHAKQNNIEATFADVVEKPHVWVGGSESHMFNCLEAIARSEKPRTPVLGARITRALEPDYVDEQFMTSRVNWVVQSSAVDYLHIMLVCMRWLFTKYEISGRFCISIHDEVRYMVSSEDCYRAALALQITNLLTRSLFALRLGFKDLPQSVAFFSGIDIDQVLRKEPHLDCVTPSNPEGLMKGYGMPPGSTFDIKKILEVTHGSLTKHEINT